MSQEQRVDAALRQLEMIYPSMREHFEGGLSKCWDEEFTSQENIRQFGLTARCREHLNQATALHVKSTPLFDLWTKKVIPRRSNPGAEIRERLRRIFKLMAVCLLLQIRSRVIAIIRCRTNAVCANLIEEGILL